MAEASSSTLTKSQATVKFNRIKKKTENFSQRNDLQTSLLDVAESVIEVYPITGTGSTSASFPPINVVRDHMKTLLPPPTPIYDDTFFKSPIFPIALLHEIAGFYGFGEVSNEFLDVQSLTQLEKQDQSVITHIWFAYLSELDRSTTRAVIDQYKRSRGSPNILLRHSQVAPAATAPPNPASPLPPAGNRQHDTIVPVSDVRVQGAEGNNARSGRSGVDDHHTGNGDRSMHSNVPTQFVDYEDPIKAGYVHQFFKNRKFTGDLTQSIDHVLRDYGTCARQNRLTDGQKAEYFVNILEGPARTFFYNNYDESMSYE